MSQVESSCLAAPLGGALPRRFLLVILGLLLFGIGQFEEALFAGLTDIWQTTLHAIGHPGWGMPAAGGLSTHSLPVAMAYRLLYCGLSVLFLLLLQGRAQWVVASYTLAFATSALLLLLGQQAGWPLASKLGHQLLDLLCSPLPLLVGYVATKLQRSSHPAPA